MKVRALEGLQVVDISRSVAGAWCSRLLADFGATVSMIEPPGGHALRQLGALSAATGALARYVLANKQSIVLDLGRAADLEQARQLGAAADVVISSFRPSELASLGLEWHTLGAPHVVMVHVTPFGMTGGRAEQPGDDLAVGALSGWAGINGEASREPLKPSGWQPSYCAGVAAYAGVLAALHHRYVHDGEGQEVDVAERDVMTAAFAPALLRGQYTGTPLGRKAETDITTGPVPVADGHFALTISRAHFWRDAMNVLGLQDLAEDSRWDAGWYRQAHKDEYVGRVQEKMLLWNRAELFEELAARRVVAGPVLTFEELDTNEHLRRRQYWTRPAHDGRSHEYPGAPFKMSETPWRLDTAAPAVEQHSTRPTPAPKPAPLPPRLDPGAHSVAPRAAGGPLAGLRGIVLTQAWAGTFCTELLGLLGADIIQVEVQKRLDSWRGGVDGPLPAALRDLPAARHAWNCNFLYNSVNLNKRCITLDLQAPEGVAVFRELLQHADFVAENFSPRVLGNLGIDYEAMRAINPRIILLSLAAYGHDGPWANVPGIGGTIEPTSGMSALLGYGDGPPLNSGQMYPDAVAGFYGCAAILTALYHRDRTGAGQYIDLSMQEANLTCIGDAALEFFATGRQRPRLGNRHPVFAPHGIFPCSGTERWITLACETEGQWEALCRFAGRADWRSDSRFANREARKQHEDALEAAIAGWTATMDRDALAAGLSASGVSAAPVLDGHEVAADAGLRARGAVVMVDHPEAGSWPQAASPLRFSRSGLPPVSPAPGLGQHSFEVLSQLLGFSESEYTALVAAGISADQPSKGE